MEKTEPGTICEQVEAELSVMLRRRLSPAERDERAASLRAACRHLRERGGHSAARVGAILGLTADRVRDLCRETADEARQRARGTR